MFDPQAKDRPLPQRLTRTIIIGAVIALVAVGGFTLIRDQFTEEPAPAPSPSAVPEPTAEAVPEVDTGATGEVDDWFPHSRAEFAQAGTAAEDFLAAAATIDFTRDEFEAHTERLGDRWATDTQAVTLTTADGIADGIWRVLGQDESVDAWTGRADVQQVRAYDSTSVHFLISLEAEPVGGDEPKELGDYLVIMTNTEGPSWVVELAEQFNN